MLLGNLSRDQGDLHAARSAYAASLTTFLAVDDPVALAEFLEDVGLLASKMGDHATAIEIVEAATVMREEVGAVDPPASQEEFLGRLEPSLAALGDGGIEAARARGRSIGRDGAVALATGLCGVSATV
jgi:hypothetical protein